MAETRSCPANEISIQLTNIWHSKETRSRSQNRTRLLTTESTLTHRQILHEGNQQVYQGHRQSQLINFLYAGPHVGILANEIRRRITACNSFHHTRTRTVSLDHVTDGFTRMPSKFPKAHGTSVTRNTKCFDLHGWCTSAHWHSWMAPGGTRTITHEATPKSRNMLTWGSASVIPRVHPNATRHQKWHSKIKSHKNLRNPTWRQIHSLLRGTVQLFPEPHTKLPNHRSASIQAHPSRFRIYIRTITKIGIWSFPNAPEATRWWTNLGFPKSQSNLPTNQQHLYTNYNSTRRTKRDIGSEGWQRRNTHHFARIKATQGEQKNYSPFLLEAAAAVWGMYNFNK